MAAKNQAIYETYSMAIDTSKMDTPENEMMSSRLCALALQETEQRAAVSVHPSELRDLVHRFGRAVSDVSDASDEFSEYRELRPDLNHEDSVVKFF